jgi:hypothetical protein
MPVLSWFYDPYNLQLNLVLIVTGYDEEAQREVPVS